MFNGFAARHALKHVLLVVGLLAFGSSDHAQVSMDQAGPESHGLRLAFRIFQEQATSGKLYRIQIRLFNDSVRSESFFNVRHEPFDPANARLAQVGAYLAALPEVTLCNRRQVEVGQKYRSEKFVKTLKPRESMTEEWTTNGIDINFASFDGTLHDGGGCLNQPGAFKVKMFLRLFSVDNRRQESFILESNEQLVSVH